MIDRARLEAIVREAGRIALAAWPGDGHACEVWDKQDTSPVSAADICVATALYLPWSGLWFLYALILYTVAAWALRCLDLAHSAALLLDKHNLVRWGCFS